MWHMLPEAGSSPRGSMAVYKEERIPDRMMDLSKEERIELVLLSGREGWSYRKIAEELNFRDPYSYPASKWDIYSDLERLTLQDYNDK
ncbi:Hypothetical predicted protein [Octopus vulgaris]|uniref:Uncharacterized protein n=1 Tax=Octopus vulgaris TaxID=6645 RepID=A0AA36B3D7_OCTVU|nr:Hypothetical predicted protein [Octopus vulgaris]